MVDKGYVDRPPRIQPVLPHGEVKIPKPPKDKANAGASLRQAILPLITILGYILVSIFGQGRNLLLILPMGLAVVISSILAFQGYRREKKEREEAMADYTQRLAEMRKEMITAHDQQRSFYLHNYPNPDLVLRIDGEGQDSRSGSRLWERRPYDDDFGVMRLGIGALESTVVYVPAGGEEEDETLTRDAEKLAEDSRIVFDVPIVLPTFVQDPDTLPDRVNKPEDATDARHAVGIAGKPQAVYPFVRAMLTHFVAFHAPTDANLHVVGLHRSEREWTWATNLPHSPVPKAKDQRAFFPHCFELETGKDPDKERDKISQFWRLLRTELDQREMRMADKNSGDVRLPFLLVIVDMLEMPANDGSWLENSSLKDLESEAAVSKLLHMGPELGASILFLVPERRKVPSGAKAVVEVSESTSQPGQLDFRYAEIGVNTARYVGRADVVNDMGRLRRFADQIARWKVRRSYGEDIPGSVTLLEMLRSENIDELEIANWWERSKEPESAQWMEGALGVMSGGTVRRLFYSADRDGVHGMIAGSTGSGKSELLMTQILGLAVRFDPSVINFVLIDYKGGAAFVPFRNLPHCVDIVTNLQGAAVDRMFAAINAELNRRQEINTVNNVKHIVQYRQKGMHLEEGRAPYPHLFVIIDEFAEMMAGNAEYKAQLNSITRLGRALGVTLILAAQRPTGVTDQMRANIKFRISLRVETREESSEMLRRPDAAYLPPGVPGRGYLQVGNENIEMIQVAYSGADYFGYEFEEEAADDTDFSQFADRPVIWLDRIEVEKEPPKLFEVLVSEMARLSKIHSVPQKKPWPSPLPSYIGLGASVPEPEYMHPEDYAYLSTAPDQTDALYINPSVTAWLAGEKSTWPGINWKERAMRAIVGLIDDPGMAQQRLLSLNLRRGHAAIFGASGWGKTVFLRTLAMGLATTHSPEELHIYILDFGGRNMEVLRDLPHVGAIITPDEDERIKRLLRRLDAVLEERKQLFSQAQASSIFSYNANPENRHLPNLLVMVDNFAEFRENFDELLPFFTSLVREGLSNGVHFVITGEQSNAVPGRLFSLFTERLALKMADNSEYAQVVGRSIPGLEEIPGRGFLAIDRQPLEFQTCIPVALTEEELVAGQDETRSLARLVEDIDDAWGSNWSDEALRPASIDTLRTFVALDNLMTDVPRSPVTAILGINDRDLAPAFIDLQQQPHFVVTGQQLSGKTSTLRSWMLSLAMNYTPDQVAFVLVDSLGYLSSYMGGKHTFADLPHTLDVAVEPEELEDVLNHLLYEYQEISPDAMKPREIFVFIDNYDDFKELKPDLSAMASLSRTRPGRPPIHFVVCGTPLGMRSPDEFLKRVTMTRYALAMDSASVESPPLNGKIPRSLREGELPLGRGFIVRSGKTGMMQVASPYGQDEAVETALDRWIDAVIDKHASANPATWIPMPEREEGDEAEAQPQKTNGRSTTSTRRQTQATPAPSRARQTEPEPNPADAYSNEQIEEFRAQIGEIYKSSGLPESMIETLINVPPENVIEMAKMRGLIEEEETTPEGSD